MVRMSRANRRKLSLQRTILASTSIVILGAAAAAMAQWSTTGQQLSNSAAPTPRDGAIISWGTFNSGTFPGSIYTGPSLFWYPRRGAFRVENIIATSELAESNLGPYSTAFGQQNTVTGTFAFASGVQNTVAGYSSLAVGNYNNALTQETFAFGDYCTATNGADCAALGYACRAAAQSAFSVGAFDTATNTCSIALGYGCNSKSYACAAVGSWNKSVGGTTGSWVATDPVFVVGNGRSGTTRSNAMVILKNGNIGLGIDNPKTYKLKVNGKVCAREIVVTDTGWSDYIFKPGYSLTPLEHVEQYIKANGHLEDIPDQAQVNREGVSVGQMQAKLLAKVEQLTLYAIDQDKRMRALATENAALKSRLDNAGIGGE